MICIYSYDNDDKLETTGHIYVGGQPWSFILQTYKPSYSSNIETHFLESRVSDDLVYQLSLLY